MNTKIIATVSAALLTAAAIAAEQEISGTLKVQNVPAQGGIAALKGSASAGAYGESRVETKLNVNISEGTEAVRFIRDNSDPYVVTKAYTIKNADPYIIRNVLRTIVSGTVVNNPVGVESIKYVDGTGVILVSAEEYRFKDVGNGMSIDEIVATLDKADLPNAIGTSDYAYFPKYNSAADLLDKLWESGIVYGEGPTARSTWFADNRLNPKALGWIDVDENMNALIMTIPGFEMKDALNFLHTVDNPRPETYLNFKLIEVYAENDQKLGLDFQSWKNNDGINLFSVGGKYGINDWGAGVIANNGHRYTEFFNFNPKWNTKFIDFLTTCGKAKVVTSGKMLVTSTDPQKDAYGTNLTISNGVFHMALELADQKKLSEVPPEGADDDWRKNEGYTPHHAAVMSDKGIFDLLDNFLVDKGNTQEVSNIIINEEDNTMFNLFVNADVHSNATNMNITMDSVSLIGWEGDGTPRVSRSNYTTSIQVGKEAKDFVIGGISKLSVTRSVSGVPFLKDIPVLGWLFSTESDTVKKTQYVLVGSIEPAGADKVLDSEDVDTINGIKAKVDKAVASPITTAGYQQLLLDCE